MDVRADVVQIARPYLRPPEVAPVSNNLQLRFAHRILRRHCHFAELPVIVSDVRSGGADQRLVRRVSAEKTIRRHMLAIDRTERHHLQTGACLDQFDVRFRLP